MKQEKARDTVANISYQILSWLPYLSHSLQSISAFEIKDGSYMQEQLRAGLPDIHLQILQTDLQTFP